MLKKILIFAEKVWKKQKKSDRMNRLYSHGNYIHDYIRCCATDPDFRGSEENDYPQNGFQNF